MRKGIVNALLVIAPLSVWLLLVVREKGRLHPRGQTVAEHLATMPEPLWYRLMTTPEGEYLAVHGPIPALYVFPSGAPVYVFGPKGALVDWTMDWGDDEGFQTRWPGAHVGRKLTREAAARWPRLEE